MISQATAEKARKAFPRGLYQPPGSYRFGLDALLLASYAEKHLTSRAGSNPWRIADAGCGCGAALLALALRLHLAAGLGLELDAALVEAARMNAQSLAMPELDFRPVNLASNRNLAAMPDWWRKCHLVMANPPWRDPGAEKRSACGQRARALWAEKDTMEVFCRAASSLLLHHGLFCAILHPHALPAFMAALAACDLGLKEILPVAPFSEHPASRILLMCRKNGRSLPELVPELILHDSTLPPDSSKHTWTRAAREFCPWLEALPKEDK